MGAASALMLVVVLVVLALLPQGAEAGAYNPPLGEDARLDQIDDYPGTYIRLRVQLGCGGWFVGWGQPLGEPHSSNPPTN